MKISELPASTTLSTSDLLAMVDMAAGTTKKLSGASAADALLELMCLAHTPMRRTLFGGRNLGSSVTDAQRTAILSGTFEDLHVGDFWVINQNRWRIVDFDYWYGAGSPNFNKHHLVIMPDAQLTTAVKMNDTPTTAGGYANSKMRTENLPALKAECDAAFPGLVLTYRDFLTTEVTDGKPTKCDWYDANVELPSEIMMYGSQIHGVSNGDGHPVQGNSNVNRTQFALFRIAPEYIKAQTTNDWLRDVVSDTEFARTHYTGMPDYENANVSLYARPCFPIGDPS